MIEKIEKEDNIIRYESLALPMSTEDEDATITFESSDPETLEISVDDKSIGFLDMANFIAFCKRAIELWDNEVQDKNKEGQT